MKHVSLILAIAFFTVYTASAQMHEGMQNQSHTGMGMMSNQGVMGNNHMNYNNMGGMMHGNMYRMMNYGIEPLNKYTFIVNLIPQMQSQLGLTTEQLNKLIDLRTAYLKQQIDLQAELSKKELTLANLIEENAPADQVKAKLQSYAQTQTDLGLAAYQSGTQMRDLLNDSQKKKLDNLLVQCFNGNCMMGGFQDTDNDVN